VLALDNATYAPASGATSRMLAAGGEPASPPFGLAAYSPWGFTMRLRRPPGVLLSEKRDQILRRNRAISTTNPRARSRVAASGT
jgi:hypothetical protein